MSASLEAVLRRWLARCANFVMARLQVGASFQDRERMPYRFSLKVPFKERFDVAIKRTGLPVPLKSELKIPIRAALHINADIPVHATIPLDTTVQVMLNVPMVGRVPIDVPIKVSIPLHMTLPLRHVPFVIEDEIAVSLDQTVAVDLDTTFPVELEKTIAVDVTLDQVLPVSVQVEPRPL